MLRLRSIVLYFICFTHFGMAQVYFKDNLQPDSATGHELTITPIIGAGEMKYLESRVADAVSFNNMHSNIIAPIAGLSLNYLLTKNASIGLSAEYQPLTFSQMRLRQVLFYNNVSNYYNCKVLPEIEASFNYYLDDEIEDLNIGASLSYQAIQCASAGLQNFYPTGITFSCITAAIPLTYDFKGRVGKKMHYFVGTCVSLSVWTEADQWSNGPNYQYHQVITPGEDFRRPNNIQLGLLFHGGIRYHFSKRLRLQVDYGFGLGTPYYMQVELISSLFQGTSKKKKN
ncbi:MAG: outer membrane beta-barrel protein [Bacteroidetes bacterium]|nr:outer membrane beta-barrel protein [Bacteroidota bacterium]